MSRLSHFVNKPGGAPLGALLQMFDAPADGAYLRCGELAPYSFAFAETVRRAPSLRVYGRDETSYYAGIGDGTVYYARAGDRYIAVAAGGGAHHGSALGAWVSYGVSSVPATLRRVAQNTAGVAFPDAGRIAVVNGTSLSFKPLSSAGFSAIAASATYWVAAASIVGATGEIGYCSGESPAGAWSATSGPALGMSRCNAVAHGGGRYVFAGASASATSGKLAVSPTPHVLSSWTDLTSRIAWQTAGGEAYDVVHDGSHWVVLTSQGVYVGQDPAQLVRCSTPLDGANWGALRLSCANGDVVLALNDGVLRVFALSRDHGASWSLMQPYVGKSLASRTPGVGALSFAGDRWVANYSGTIGGLVDLGATLAGVPDYVGAQHALGVGWFVRIK